FGLGRDLELAGCEVFPALDWVQASLLEQVTEGRCARAPGVTVPLARADLPLDVGEPATAVPGPLDLQVGLPLAKFSQGGAQLVLLSAEPDLLRAQGVE